MEDEVWATILALIWLHGEKMDAEDEWSLLAQKALSWLQATNGMYNSHFKMLFSYQFLLRTQHFVLLFCSTLFCKVCGCWKFAAWLQSEERRSGTVKLNSGFIMVISDAVCCPIIFTNTKLS